MLELTASTRTVVVAGRGGSSRDGEALIARILALASSYRGDDMRADLGGCSLDDCRVAAWHVDRALVRPREVSAAGPVLRGAGDRQHGLLDYAVETAADLRLCGWQD